MPHYIEDSDNVRS